MGSQLRDYQTTIAERVSLSGVGVHSGAPVTMTFVPSAADTGIVFHRRDGEGRSHAIKALVSEVGTTDLSTTLGKRSGATVSTVEHVMAAISGAGIDNLIIEIDAPEVPIVDGTSAAFLVAFDEAGLVQQTARRRCSNRHASRPVPPGRSSSPMTARATRWRSISIHPSSAGRSLPRI